MKTSINPQKAKALVEALRTRDESIGGLKNALSKLAELQKKHALELEALEVKQADEWDALFTDHDCHSSEEDGCRVCFNEGRDGDGSWETEMHPWTM